MKKINKRTLFLAVLMLVMMFSMQAFGDTGNNTDYNEPSSSYSSSSSSSDDGLVGMLFQMMYALIFSALPLPIKILVFVVLAGVVWFVKAKKPDLSGLKELTNEQNTITQQAPRIPNNTSSISMQIKENDPLFSSNKFLGWVEEVFMSLQSAWTLRSWEQIRPFEKEELYKIHEKQLEEYKRNGTINVVERINVNQSYLYQYEQDEEFEYLKVYLSARMNDYIIDEETKEVVKGNKNKEYHNKYILTFMRSVGVKTDKALSNVSTKQCPHCGAPTQVTSAGKCEYCDTIITTGEFDWVLSDIDKVDRGFNY